MEHYLVFCFLLNYSLLVSGHIPDDENFKKYLDMTNISLKFGITSSLDRTDFGEFMMDTRYKEYNATVKFHYGLLLLLQEFHNFSYTLQFLDNDILNQDQHIDITSADDVLKILDSKNFQSLMPFYTIRSRFLFKNPGTYTSTKEFLEPFENKAWKAFLVMCVIISVLLGICFYIEAKVFQFDEGESWTSSFFILVAVFCQQGSWAEPFGAGGRLTFLSLLITSLLLYNFYTSSMVSSLIGSTPPTFHTLDELAASDLKLSIDDGAYTKEWLEKTQIPEVKKFYQKHLLVNHSVTTFPLIEGIEKINGSSFAYYTETAKAYPIIEKTFDLGAICDVNEIEMIPAHFASFALSTKIDIKETFQRSLLKLNENGFVDRLKRTWEDTKMACFSPARVHASNMKQVMVIFLILFGGLCLAIVFLVLEILLKRNIERNFVFEKL